MALHGEPLIAHVFQRSSMPGVTDFPLGWFAVSHLFIESKKTRRTMRNHWFKIETNDRAIFRVLRFAPNLRHSDVAEIAVDYQGWVELLDYPEDLDVTATLIVTKANLIEILKGMLRHPEPSYRCATWLGLISVVLGCIGVVGIFF